jgi:uncharacterized OB-fold protein
VPTELSRDFWDAAAEHRLVLPKCNDCGGHFFPPERLCPASGSPDWKYVESSGTGTVSTYSVVYRVPSPDFDSPYVLAIVELDEGCNMLTNLVVAEPESVSIGMAVHVTFLDLPGGRALPVFAPGSPNDADEPGKGNRGRDHTG